MPTPVADDEQAAADDVVVERHPAVAGYADYGDFACWRLAVSAIRWVGGFGRMDWIDADAYRVGDRRSGARRAATGSSST